MTADAPIVGASPDDARALRNWARREKVSAEEASRRLDQIAKIRHRAFSFENPPTEPEPRFWVAGKPAFTPGNVGVLQAQAGTGKTSFKAAMLSARICAECGQDADTLGITASADASGVLLNLDTEQSPYDHDVQIRRALKRAGASAPPEWLQSYGLAGLSAAEIQGTLRALLWQSAIDGIYAVIIDGVADLVKDVNDAEECNAFVAELHALAIQYETPIIGILHENPGSDNGKGRGHLGSQLTRKAETVLRLVKSGEVTTVFSQKARRAPILEKDGPRFTWSDDAGMHVSCASMGSSRDEMKRAELQELAEEVIGTGRMRYAEVLRGIESARRIAPKTAEKRFSELKKAEVIAKDAFGFWSMKAQAEHAA